MKNCLDSLKRINGNSDSDAMIASDFCKECLREAQERAAFLAQLGNLKIILDDTKFATARSSLAGLRHIRHAVKEAAAFHANGNFGTTFANLQAEIDKLVEPAEEIYRTLRELYPTER